jgi:general secretion pathway protein F
VDAAVDELYAAGLTPFETAVSADNPANTKRRSSSPTNISSPKYQYARSDKLSLKELAAFTLELASLRSSGLPLDTAFRIMATPGARSKISRLAENLKSDVIGGLQLSEAMARRPDVFPPDYLAILAAGEAGGATGQVLRQISDLLNRRVEVRNKILSALVYPAILIVMSMMSIMVIIFVLVPNIAPIFGDAGVPLPGILLTLSNLQDNWMQVAVAAAMALVVASCLWKLASQNPDMMRYLDRAKCKVPFVGKMIQLRDAGSFARALGALLNARVQMVSAMRIAQALVINRHLNGIYADAIACVPEGTPLHRAFDKEMLIPSASLRLIAVGEETGQLASMLLQAAATIEGDLQRKIERMVGLTTPVLTVVVGGGIGGLIMQVMSAVLSINELAFR